MKRKTRGGGPSCRKEGGEDLIKNVREISTRSRVLASLDNKYTINWDHVAARGVINDGGEFVCDSVDLSHSQHHRRCPDNEPAKHELERQKFHVRPQAHTQQNTWW